MGFGGFGGFGPFGFGAEWLALITFFGLKKVEMFPEEYDK